MNEAREAVAEPSQPKVKLRLPAKTPEPPPKITLRFGQKSAPENANGVSVDSEALKRQQDLVKAGTSGNLSIVNGDPSKSPGKDSHSLSLTTSQMSGLSQPLQHRRSGSAASPPLTNGVKNELQLTQPPALPATAFRQGSGTSNEATQSPQNTITAMPPPTSVNARVSPLPLGNHVLQNYQQSNPLDSRFRQPGKGILAISYLVCSRGLTCIDASDALMSNLTIATHPGLTLKRHFHLDIPPSPTMSQQSVTITLPATHYCIQVFPTIASHVVNRQSRIFVTLNNQRINPTPMKADELDPRRPLYDMRLMPGVNRLEVEMIAGPSRGVPKVGLGQDIEIERVTLFVNLTV